MKKLSLSSIKYYLLLGSPPLSLFSTPFDFYSEKSAPVGYSPPPARPFLFIVDYTNEWTDWRRRTNREYLSERVFSGVRGPKVGLYEIS